MDAGDPDRIRRRNGGPCLAAALLLSLLLSGCTLYSPQEPLLKKIRSRGLLIVGTRYAPTTLFEGPDQRMGLEHDLATAFARRLGVNIDFRMYDSNQAILEAVRTEAVDLAAAGLVRSSELEEQFRLGPVYQEVDQEVVCRRGGVRPNNLLALTRATLVVPRGGSAEQRLRELASIVPELTWRSDPFHSVEEILEQVGNGEVDCTVADSNIVAINRRYFPELVVKFPINATQSLSWVLPKRAYFLHKEVVDWFREMEQSGGVMAMMDQYFAHVVGAEYDYVDNRAFLNAIAERLPRLRGLFLEAGGKYKVPWRLLAALSYQESHWYRLAKSPTGVQGLMMLARDTARHLEVKDRTDPEESIDKGAGYLMNLLERLPQSIQEPDRTWFALAAYNVGMGHIHDARHLARLMKKDPNAWRDIEAILPLLSNPRYYTRLKHGYARGMEPVRYVRKVREYYNILVQREAYLTQGPAGDQSDDPVAVRLEEEAPNAADATAQR
ncbi:MAG: membrane-bound lytic murein transglycosylase MltF [Magnetococcales bacterium]|nr:membrane-bound lytic murein transglycosylase MltF [Magnetococcales bacterium]